MKIKLLEEYPYLYETHLHTNSGSACGRNTGAEMAAACKKAGYTGTFVTDHNWGGNTCINRELAWEEWMTLYAKGYEDAAEYGQANDFDVFFGMETGFDGTEFLICGLTPQWFIENPAMWSADIPKQYEIVKNAGGMVVQAHPYRKEDYIPVIRTFPQYADAIEGSNATHSSPFSISHNNPEWDDQARKLAAATGKPMTAGSDVHSTNLFGGGVAFKRRLSSGKDYCNAILGGEDYILSDGKFWRRKDGTIICEMEITDNN
ncbi:MAG: PHP domain-containing protein [Lachnospiraceae bacterium]|nr:PHP domain-containing protein [Lachnospiraceae bacterium]